MKILLIAILFTLLASQAKAGENIVILIPGFFNFPGSGQPGDPQLSYFSSTILNTIRNHNYTPIIIDTLNPVGGLWENSQLLQKALRDVIARHPQATFKAIAHSAGGLYLAQALTMRPDLPIHTVVTVGTPYSGARLVDLLANIPGFREITDSLNLEAVNEFKSANMASFLNQLRLPAGIRWVALAGAQDVCGGLNCVEAQNQSWLFSLAWRFAREMGDGVVTSASAMATSLHIMNATGQEAAIERWDMVIPLDHWEQVLEAPLFEVLGVVNTPWIAKQQAEVFDSILGRI